MVFDQVCDQVFDKFVQVGDTFVAFDFFVENPVANLLHQSRHAKIDAADSLVRLRDRQMECRKTCFEPANEPVKAGFSLRILLFVLT